MAHISWASRLSTPAPPARPGHWVPALRLHCRELGKPTHKAPDASALEELTAKVGQVSRWFWCSGSHAGKGHGAWLATGLSEEAGQ